MKVTPRWRWIHMNVCYMLKGFAHCRNFKEPIFSFFARKMSQHLRNDVLNGIRWGKDLNTSTLNVGATTPGPMWTYWKFEMHFSLNKLVKLITGANLDQLTWNFNCIFITTFWMEVHTIFAIHYSFFYR